jgi:serine/threonine-protein kinase
MRVAPAERYPTARAVAADIDAWLEGSRARERAMGLVDEARRRVPALAEARLKANRSRERARASVVSLRPSDPLEVKEAAWALEDQAQAYAGELDERYQEISTRARLALAQVPDLPEARAILADQYRERAEAAEAMGDTTAARELRALLAAYDDGRHAAYLRADGELRLSTTPKGAQVHVYRYEQQSRRLVTTERSVTGPTPVFAQRLPVGSYLLELVVPDRPPVRYPVLIAREQPWASVAPGSRVERPVWIPPTGEIRSVERYVPAGWFLSGGDPEAQGALPRRRVWVESCSLSSRPVTFADYLTFLNDRIAQGAMDAAQRHMPRLQPRDADVDPLVALDTASDRFRLRDTVGALRLSKSSPVVGVSWYDAQAYCRWLGERTRLPWRLPGEHEREKAARGVDGRSYPWGEHADPAFHCMQDSALASPGPPSTSLFPVDQSPYAIFGLAGGVQEWCADVYRTEGPRQRGSCAVVPSPPTDADTRPGAHAARRAVRGGAWDLPAPAGRGASRVGARPGQRTSNRGFRVCRSLTDAQGAAGSKR